jgi:transposase InsO family protein
VLGVSRAGYYAFVRRRQRGPDAARQAKLEAVRQMATEFDLVYGTRRMARELTQRGHRMGRYQTRGLMCEAGVRVRYCRRYRVTTESRHRHPVFPNRLQRCFHVAAPNRVWASDISYVWTAEGWLYLAVVIDLYARKVVGWSLGQRLTSALACDALRMALGRRRPRSGSLLHHSDQGVQYASRAFRGLLKAYGVTGSMSRKGDCWDNAGVESFFGSLKSERVYWRSYQTRDEARRDIVDYIAMFYNSRRLHSSLGYQSPDTFEKQGHLGNAA